MAGKEGGKVLPLKKLSKVSWQFKFDLHVISVSKLSKLVVKTFNSLRMDLLLEAALSDWLLRKWSRLEAVLPQI